ncbi:MAG: MltA domain-containing protein [Comamonadaceae bacterium]|nr:MltA domain-containing protein [Comamonadaceae bacterium]
MDWTELPGWHADRTAASVWPALQRELRQAGRRLGRASAWRARLPPAGDARRARLAARSGCGRTASSRTDGTVEGLATGYFEPLVDARRAPTRRFRVALHAPAGRPGDAPARTGRASSSTPLPAAQAALRGREIAYVADPLDALAAADPGLGPAARHRARRPGAHGAPGLRGPPTTSPTSRWAAG